MRLAFLAAAAQFECPNGRHRPNRLGQRKKTVNLDNLLPHNSSYHLITNQFITQTLPGHLGHGARSCDHLSPNNDSKFCSASSKIYRRPILAFWHLISVLSFFLSAKLVSSSSDMADDDQAPFWTPSSREPFSYHDQESDEESSDSCHRYDYFLSPMTSSPAVNLVRRSVTPDPTVDNVFAVWLRASRYGTDPDEETSWPLQRPRTRHRYQYYRNIRLSTRRFPTSTPRVISPRIRASFSSPSPKMSPRKKPAFGRGEKGGKYPQCKVFDQACIDELCGLDVAKRVQELRNVYVRTNMAQREPWTDFTISNTNLNLNSSASNLSLYEFFALDIQKDWQLSRPSVSHLADALRPCINSDPFRTNQSAQCRTCYKKILTRLKKIDSSHEAFSQSVLSMIDCEPDNDLERFSPTSNCSECKLWYKRWLLVIYSDIWKQKPCLQWCHLAELACPHLSPVRQFDYAGLPSFRCTDPEISLLSAGNSTYGPDCDCVHPCDSEAFTKHWRWNITGDYETREFCRDYIKRDQGDCPAKKARKSKPAAGHLRSSTKEPKNGADSDRRTTKWPFWSFLLLMPLCLDFVQFKRAG